MAYVTQDATRERLTAQMRARQIRESARAEELGNLVRATSHHLRTQVRQIRSFSQLIDRQAGSDLEPGARELLGQIIQAAGELSELHAALREYGEISTVTGTWGTVDLTEVVDRATQRLTVHPEGRGLIVETGELPQVAGSAEHLIHLFFHLLQNAGRFRAEAPARVDIDATRQDGMWEIHVRDHGEGFDPRLANRVFEVFEQLNPGHGRPGVGIGLTICRSIVRAHGGSIRAETEPGQGTTITFTLPSLELAAAEEAWEGESRPPAPQLRPGERPSNWTEPGRPGS